MEPAASSLSRSLGGECWGPEWESGGPREECRCPGEGSGCPERDCRGPGEERGGPGEESEGPRGECGGPGEGSGLRALLDAISRGQLRLARIILEAAGEGLLESRGPGARTPLMFSVLLLDPGARGRLLRLFLGRGARVNSQDGDGRTALSLACERGFLDSVRLLVQHNAHPELVDRWGNTPLLYAAATGHGEVLDFLVRAFKRLGLDIEHHNRVGNSARGVATFLGHRHCVQALGTVPRRGAQGIQLPPCQGTGQLRGTRDTYPLDRDIGRDRDRDRQTNREIDREIDRETDRKIDWDRKREIDRAIDRKIDRETDRETDRKIDWDRERDIDREIDWVIDRDRDTEADSEKNRDRDRDRDRFRDKGRDRNTDRDGDKERDRDRNRDRNIYSLDRDRDRETDRDTESDRNRDRDRDRGRDRVRVRAAALWTRLESMGSIDEEERDQDGHQDQDRNNPPSQNPQSPRSRLRSHSVQYSGHSETWSCLLPPLIADVCPLGNAAPHSPRPARSAATPWGQPGVSTLDILLTPISSYPKRGALGPADPQGRNSPGLLLFQHSYYQKRCSLPTSALPAPAPDRLLPSRKPGAGARGKSPAVPNASSTTFSTLGSKLLRRFTFPHFRKDSGGEYRGSAAPCGMSRSETFPITSNHPQISNKASIESISGVQCEFDFQLKGNS